MQYLKPCLPEFSGGRGRGKRGKVEGQEQVVGGGSKERKETSLSVYTVPILCYPG